MAFEKHDVVPDVVDKAPAKVLEITYPTGAKVQGGNILTPTQVKDQPSVKWQADKNEYYLLCMTDPDNLSRKEPTLREWHHWLVGNIPGNDISKGEVLTEFLGSGPRPGTGLHRYVFLLYKQPGKLNFTEKRITNRSAEGRENFSSRNFAKKYNLGDPVAGNLYQAEWDQYVPLLYKQLGE
ncbi:phosphatidylethanolamine-binding protein homolog F40A3.3-like [Agrilus planipennis]|uniref:Phosphatidylethanolamine-binding protein homolog F40A3.3-like n=1 Tax=Agrilus planipennis TaxID=224129 RepID=A0A1W4WJY1_AGRPL|nr:phosphatidylethanolamine-binding protein homolog F40A3.3-like [Agrilus planipennis]XP_018324234.1 phosphatidylethanolamine-binding protein homolog F40A3.3-like [Agrilus planipennis]